MSQNIPKKRTAALRTDEYDPKQTKKCCHLVFKILPFSGTLAIRRPLVSEMVCQNQTGAAALLADVDSIMAVTGQSCHVLVNLYTTLS